jgi:hypothetical protein
MERDVSFLFFTEKKNVQYVKTDPTCVQYGKGWFGSLVGSGSGPRTGSAELLVSWRAWEVALARLAS